MSMKRNGNQTIGCNVTSCRHHDDSCSCCELNGITVEPMCGCNSGEPCDESMCGNYAQK